MQWRTARPHSRLIRHCHCHCHDHDLPSSDSVGPDPGSLRPLCSVLTHLAWPMRAHALPMAKQASLHTPQICCANRLAIARLITKACRPTSGRPPPAPPRCAQALSLVKASRIFIDRRRGHTAAHPENHTGLRHLGRAPEYAATETHARNHVAFGIIPQIENCTGRRG